MTTRRLRTAVRELSVSSRLSAIELEIGSMPGDEVFDAIAATARLGALLQARSIALAAQAGRSTPPPSPDLLDAGQAAERLHLSLPTVYRLAKGGELPAVRIGGAVRFEPNAVAAFVNRRSDPAGDPPGRAAGFLGSARNSLKSD
jgi:excisionase family DNA binding protein